MILDAGPAAVGLESTHRRLRGRRASAAACGRTAGRGDPGGGGRARAGRVRTKRTSVPTLRAASRATTRRDAHIRLDAETPREGEAWLGFGPAGPEADGVRSINLSPRGDLVEAAARLFAALRTLDATGADVIAVAPVPESGLGLAINDRLRRAAVR